MHIYDYMFSMNYNKINTSGEQNRINQVAEEALANDSLRTLWHEVAWEGRDENSNEYDPRRRLAKEGIDLLENALTSVGDRKEQREFRSGDRGSLKQEDIMHFSAGTDEEAIVGMRQLIQGRIEDTRKTWGQIAGMTTEDGTPIMHTHDRGHFQLRARYHDALERGYEWQMREEGFNAGLHSLGLEVKDGSVVESDSIIVGRGIKCC